MQTQNNMLAKAELFSERVLTATKHEHNLLKNRKSSGQKPALTKKERAEISKRLSLLDQTDSNLGVNFSRIQITELLRRRDSGAVIEFETIGPYVASYIKNGGIMTPANLTPEDAIGIKLAKTLRQFFPKARLVSLCDDYNAQMADGQDHDGTGNFAPKAVQNLRHSLIDLLKQSDVLEKDAQDELDYLLISETAKITDVERLVNYLDRRNMIERRGEAIYFVNDDPENPIYHRIHLRTEKGKWLCHALDAAAFLSEGNLQTNHIIVLPEYMKAQQDKTWEILRTLGLSPKQYHNILFDPTMPAQNIAQIIENEFLSHM